MKVPGRKSSGLPVRQFATCHFKTPDVSEHPLGAETDLSILPHLRSSVEREQQSLIQEWSLRLRIMRDITESMAYCG
jgi:hypothetical protein